MLMQHLRHSRLPSAFLAAGKTQLGLHKDHLLCGRSICILSRPQNASRISFPFSYLDAWFHFCLTSDLSAFCYGHKMQLGTLACGKQSSACLAAGKMPLGLHKDHLLCGRSICILSRPQNASRISFPFRYLDTWPHFCLTSDLSAFCYRHKMQLGTLACWKQSSACLAAGKMPLGLHKDHLLCGRSICILSRPQNASRIPFPLNCLDAWPHFCLTSDLSALRHFATVTKCNWELWLVGNSHLHV